MASDEGSYIPTSIGIRQKVAIEILRVSIRVTSHVVAVYIDCQS